MKLSISNIAWDISKDDEIYILMKKYGYIGLEIAPTRIVSTEQPYSKENITKAKQILENTGFEIPSAQSILYGKNEKLFGSEEERARLLNYLYKAIDYAEAVNCNNLVFGSPKNRVINDIAKEYNIAVDFFNKAGNYASNKNVIIAIEANPKIYGTNFINDTYAAFQFVKDINNTAIKINYDLGTVIENNENINDIEKFIEEINHIHISEPYLELIKERNIHKKLFNILKSNNYEKYISIEMKKQDNILDVKNTLKYISGIFYANK